MHIRYCLIGTSLLAAPAAAQQMTVTIDIPRLKVAEYHKPYVAVWIEDDKGKHIADLAHWYDLKMAKNEGIKWLPDMRTWWRRAGRATKMPVDGVSSPTRGPGKHALSFTAKSSAVRKLGAGSYKLKVEAAREVGGREVLSVPFAWPPKGAKSGSAAGTKELKSVTFSIKP